jgi:hypothetical protein
MIIIMAKSFPLLPILITYLTCRLMYMTLTSTQVLRTSEINGTIMVPHIFLLNLIEHSCVYMCYLTHSQVHMCIFLFLKYLLSNMNF